MAVNGISVGLCAGAESEVVSMLARGADRREIALGIHQAIISRIKSMLFRVSVCDGIVFIGGGALNKCLIKLMQSAFGKNILIPDDLQIVGVYGCALYSANGHR